ncbi:MAG: DNA recombination protein RmuC [Actinomycetes bacterium]
METYIFLLIGLVVGALAGFLVGKARSSAGVIGDAGAQLADAKARVELLGKQVVSLENERSIRERKDQEENRLINELAPVKENLKQMREAVTKMETDRAEQMGKLGQAIQQSIESDEALRKQTSALSAALSSNSVRGVWGETQLRKLVELAGLLKHADFDEQATITAGRADMIINLPGGKHLAIDSKVPYNSFQEASQISELSEGAEKDRRQQLLKEHVKAVRKHIDDLSTKQYWNALKASPDFVICFIPSESLLSASLEADPTLLEYAFKQNVAVASPVSVFSVLKTINFIWRQNVDESQVRKMLLLGQELYERVGKIAEAADKLGRSINSTVKDYNTFVSSFETRMLVTARKLNDLDENELGTTEIISPKSVEDQAKALSAPELETKEIEEKTK